MQLNPVSTSVTTVGNATLTAAALLGGTILRSGPVGAFADTFDTAVLIASAAANTPNGSAWEVSYVNNSSQTATLTASAGVTLNGASASIPTNTVAQLLVTINSVGAVTITVLWRNTVT